MNRQSKNNAYKANKMALGPHYAQGLVKLSNETLEHFTVKCQAAHWFYKNGWEVFSEAQFTSPYKGRADLVVFHRNGDAYCVEILKSETEKRFNEKDYPFPIIKIKVATWEYYSFSI
jgi:hypothetical protein